MSLLSLSNVKVEYSLRSSRLLALDGVSLDIPSSGYTIGLVGESGSGKTTLGMSIMNLIEPPGRIVSGKIEYQGKDVLRMRNELRKYRWEEVAMVFQSAMNSLNPVKRVSDHIIEVMIEHGRASKADARSRALKLLEEVAIPTERAHDYPHELSGGMKQRVAVAMALALSPKVLIADEPTSALDVVVQKQVLSMLKRETARRGLSLIFITHELAILGGLVDNIAVMFRGEIVERGPSEKVLLNPLHPYTEMLLDSLLTLDRESRSVGSPAKTVDATKLYPGSYCKYVSRCKYAFDRCTREAPLLREIEKERWVSCHKYP